MQALSMIASTRKTTWNLSKKMARGSFFLKIRQKDKLKFMFYMHKIRQKRKEGVPLDVWLSHQACVLWDASPEFMYQHIHTHIFYFFSELMETKEGKTSIMQSIRQCCNEVV